MRRSESMVYVRALPRSDAFSDRVVRVIRRPVVGLGRLRNRRAVDGLAAMAKADGVDDVECDA